MNFSLLRSVRSLSIYAQCRVNQFNRFGTCASLQNKSQDSDGDKPSDSKPDDTLQIMRDFSRQRYQQRRERGNRSENGYSAGNPRTSNMKQFADNGTQSAVPSPSGKQAQKSHETRGESLSIFDRLIKKNAENRHQTSSTQTEYQEPRADARPESSADTAPKSRAANLPKKAIVTAPLKSIDVEKLMPTRSRWIDKQRKSGHSDFDESKKNAKALRSSSQSKRLAPSNTDSPQDPTLSAKDETDALYRSIQLEITGHDEAVLRSYAEFLRMSAHGLGIADSLERVWTTPRHFYRRTLLKSNFVHKLHRRQYEIRTYFLFARLVRLTGSTADTLLEYAQRNLPEGTAMKVTYERIEPLPSRILQSLGMIPQSNKPNEATQESVQG